MKTISKVNITLILVLALCAIILGGCGGSSGSTSTATQPPTATQAPTTTPTPGASPINTEQPVPALSQDQASQSDIADTQVFVTYKSTSGGYQLDTPEGWARTDAPNGTDASFVSNLNSMQVTISSATTQPTASSVKVDQAVTLQNYGRAIRDVKVTDVTFPSGPAVLIEYTSNSDPNSVTGKQVRLINNRYLFFNNGKLATLTLSAPLGADNVDQWKRISTSFKWV